MTRRDTLRALGAAVLAGLLGAFAFPLVIAPFGPEPIFDRLPREAGIVGCALLVYRVTQAPWPPRRKFAIGFSAGAVYFAIVLYWLDIAMGRYGQMPQWQALPALTLLVIYCALYWGAIAWLTNLLHERVRIPATLAFAFAVVVLEWLRGVLLTGFPWGLWGYSQARNLSVVQFAAYGGVYAVSFAIALCGALLSRYLQARNTPRALGAGLAVGALVVAVYSVGWLRLASRPSTSAPPVRVAVAQGSVDQLIKNQAASFRELIVGRYEELTDRAVAAGADVVIWPEAAWPSHLPVDINQFPVKPRPVPLLVGAPAYRLVAGRPEAFNSAFWVEPGGRVSGRYDKLHLVPFGEYVPLHRILAVSKLVPDIYDYSPGTSTKPIGSPPWGVLVCYDGLFPEITRAEVRQGAQLLANLTNDAWYGVSSAAYQHRDFYVLRAVESDRWVVRAANTGLSVFIDPHGRLYGETQLEQETVAMHTVQPRRGKTFYVMTGDWLVACGLGLTLAALLRLARLKLARRHSV